MFELYAVQNPKTHGRSVQPTDYFKNLKRVTSNGTGNFCERRRRESLGVCGGMLPSPPENFQI